MAYKPNHAEEFVQELLAASDEPTRYMREMIFVNLGAYGFELLSDELFSEGKQHTPEQVARLEEVLLAVAQKNKPHSFPEFLSFLPKYLDFAVADEGKPSKERSALLFEIASVQTINVLAEKLKPLEGGAKQRGLEILAFFCSKCPDTPEARKFIPVFAEEAAAGYSTTFAEALILMGAEGVDALLEKAESAGKRGRKNILKMLVIANTNNIAARFFFPCQASAKLAKWSGEIACLEGDANFAAAVITRLSDIGLPAAEPLILFLKKGLPEDKHNRCLSALSSIAEKNHNAPVLEAAVPFFLEKKDWRTIVNIGTPAIPALLKEFDKNPADAEKIADVLKKIDDGVRKINNGVVAKPVRPAGLENVFAGCALDLKPSGNLVRVK